MVNFNATNQNNRGESRCVYLSCKLLIIIYIYIYIYLDFKYAVNAFGGSLILFGTAWSVLEDDPSPREIIESTTPLPDGSIASEDVERILSLEDRWAGSYLLFINGVLYNDALGTKACYYADIYVSNSYRFIVEMLGLPPVDMKVWQGIHSHWKWMAGPLTHHSGVCRLLSDQKYDVHTQTLSYRSLNIYNRECFHSEEEVVERFISTQRVAYRKMYETLDGTFVLALSGGVDSRTNLSFFLDRKLPFECFTLHYEKMPNADLELPQLLKQKFDLPLEVIDVTEMENNETLVNQWHENAGYIIGHDKIMFCKDYFDKIRNKYKKDIYLITGNEWAFIQWIFKWQPAFDDKDWSLTNLPDFVHKNCITKMRQKVCATYLVDWVYAHSGSKVSPDVRFYASEYIASNVAPTVFNVSQLVGTNHIYPANCRYLMSMILNIRSLHKNRDKRFERMVVNKLLPEAIEIPYQKSYLPDPPRKKQGKQSISWKNENRNIKHRVFDKLKKILHLQ